MSKQIESNEELQIIEDVANDKYESMVGSELTEMRAMLKSASTNTLTKLTKRKAISIRLLESDIDRLKSMALHEGLPYQTFISHMIHKITTGELKAV